MTGMSIETADELEGLRRAGRVVAAALVAMEAAIAEGITTGELDEVAQRVFDDHGARSTPRHEVGFPAATCISVNEEAVHGIPSGRKLLRDDVVKIDVTADLDGFVADAARTVVVEPRSHERLRLAWCARSAFNHGLAAAIVGHRTDDIGAAVEGEVHRAGFRVIRSLCGHGVGRSMHESPQVPNYREPRMRSTLTHRLVITIEPIICAGSGRAVESEDGWTVRTADGSMAAHYEQTVVVTNRKPIVLTEA